MNGPNAQMPAFDPYAFFELPGNDMVGKGQPWIGDLTDEITVLVATREYEIATAKIEKGIVPLLINDKLTALKRDLPTHSWRQIRSC